MLNDEGFIIRHYAGAVCYNTVSTAPYTAPITKSITSILLYILVPVPVKYPPMELRELHTRGRRRGRVSPVHVPVKYPPMELGGNNLPPQKEI